MKKMSSICCFIIILLASITVIKPQDSTGSTPKQDTTGVSKSQDTGSVSKTTDTSSTAKEEMQPDAAVLYNAGNELQKANNFQGAVSKYDSALAFAKDYRIYHQKGVAYTKLEKLDSAKTAFDNAIQLKPDFEASYKALGSVYFAKGDLEKAIETYNKLLGITKDTADQNTVKKTIALVYYKSGTNSIAKKKYQDAITNLQKSVEFNNFDAAYLSLAKAYSETKKWDQSIEAAENAVKYQANISKAGPYYYMGIAYKNKGDKVKAKEMFTQAKADPAYKKAADYEISQLNEPPKK